jgi:hypothetical protein
MGRVGGRVEWEWSFPILIQNGWTVFTQHSLPSKIFLDDATLPPCLFSPPTCLISLLTSELRLLSKNGKLLSPCVSTSLFKHPSIHFKAKDINFSFYSSCCYPKRKTTSPLWIFLITGFFFKTRNMRPMSIPQILLEIGDDFFSKTRNVEIGNTTVPLTSCQQLLFLILISVWFHFYIRILAHEGTASKTHKLWHTSFDRVVRKGVWGLEVNMRVVARQREQDPEVLRERTLQEWKSFREDRRGGICGWNVT